MPRLPKENPEHGKKPNQKLKPYLVLQYLMLNSDESHTISAEKIAEALQNYGIDAERRSIYKDIEEINKAQLIITQNVDVWDAEDLLADDADDEVKLVAYDKHSKGFYVKNRAYDLNDLRLLAECVYSSKFLSEQKARKLSGVVGSLASRHERDAILHDIYLVKRSRTDNKYVNLIASTISDAMNKELDGKRKAAEKISFKYLEYDLSNLHERREHRGGALYIVSPYKLLINDDNYYLLAFNDEAKAMRTYRLDRMKDVKRLIGIPREGEEDYLKLNVESYTQRTTNMYDKRDSERITIRCSNTLLNPVIDRFGIDEAVYRKLDDHTFAASITADISEQFFGWILGFGDSMKIVSPQSVVDEFKEYIDRVRKLY